MKRSTIYIALLWLCQVGYAQQQAMFTQYMFNGLVLNPAYAGSHETVSATALAREQWTGIDGAPSTQTFSLHSPVVNQRFALGLVLLHDEIGVTDQTGAYLSYAYRIPVSENIKLSFGLQGGVTFFDARLSEAFENDQVGIDVSESQGNFGFGTYIYSDRFYAGISVPQLLENEFDRDNPDSDSRIVRHYFGTVGYVFDLSRSLKLKPNILVKAVDGAPLEFDVNANFLIHDIVWLGVSWRSFDSFDALVQFQVTPKLQFGYAYDFATTSELRRVNGGSHEFMVNYRFGSNKSRIITPRYF
ncbi:type IX secretion system membrane protein PorP/SprF [Fulvivirga sp. M361]|uniref:PorP/SprF family type IX secretion system membrane protein n=1 Tax=Fulvivirga sp. M361 TaxID=2594266 RepID=UPI0016270701|nr:type IX secretion system membrane protein PorP/SprF [Fulvivirga sp. M361]